MEKCLYSNYFLNNPLMDKIIKDNDDDKEIQVKDINFNNGNSIKKTVVDNNNCSLIFNKNSKLLDTGNVKSMLKAKKIPCCSTR